MDAMAPRTIHDDFDAGVLDAGLWIDHYLPQWTTPGRLPEDGDHPRGAGIVGLTTPHRGAENGRFTR